MSIRSLILGVAILFLFSGCTTVKNSFQKKPATLDDQLQVLSDQIVNSLSEKNKSKIAVIEFSNLDGSVSKLGRYIAEELITRLYRTDKFEVVERNMLNKIMEEHQLTLSGFVDESSAREIGRILGVDAIASGSVTDLVDEVKINARLISTETGKIFSVASVRVEKTSDVLQLLQEQEQLAPANKPGQSSSTDGSAVAIAQGDDLSTDFTVLREGFRIELNWCVLVSETLKMAFTVTNQSGEDKDYCIKYGRPSTEMFDNFGNQYPISVMRIANSEMNMRQAGRYHYRNLSKKLIQGVATTVEMEFHEVNTKASTVKLLQVNGCEYTFSFRNIPIKKQ